MSATRIAHIITTLGTGGAESMLMKLLANMDRSRFDAHVVSLTGRGTYADDIEKLGIPVTTCDMLPGRLSVRGIRRLDRILRDVAPDIVQTWLYHADLLGGIVARLRDIPTVLWNIRHSNLDRDKNKRHTLLAVRLNAWLSHHIPEHIICNSRRAIDAHVAVGYDPARFVLIPNGFDCERLKPDPCARLALRAEFGIGNEAPVVGLVARFDSQKNHRGFIEAAALVAAGRPDARYILIGRDVTPDNSLLMGWIDETDLRDKVYLLGERRDIPRLTASFDVGICASWGEGFPNSIGEAMACGVPCVVTNVGDCAEIVGDTGRIVASGDMQSLAINILDLLAMAKAERQALGLRARKRMIEHYSITAVASAYERLYSHFTT